MRVHRHYIWWKAMPKIKLERKYRHDLSFTKEMHEKLTLYAMRTKRTKADIVEEALREYFKNHKIEV
jgi:hypothetical protein